MRSSAQPRLKAFLPSRCSRQGRQGSSLPVPEAFLPVGIKVETKHLSCPGVSGVISPRGQKGTHQIAVSKVAAAPQGRSCHLGAIRGEGKVCTKPPESACVSCPCPGSWLPPASAPRLSGTHSSPTFAGGRQHTKGALERECNPLLLAFHSISVIRAIIYWGFLFLFEILKYKICIHMYA